MRIITIFLAAFLLYTAELYSRVPFANGEKLTYVMSYKAKLFPLTDVANATLHTTIRTEGGEEFFHVYANAQCEPFFRWFYHLNDTYRSWINTETLRPHKLEVELEEGEYRYWADYNYNWDNQEVYVDRRSLKNPDVKRNTMTLKAKSFDATALIYNLRATDQVKEYHINKDMILELVLEDTIRNVSYKFLGREVKRIRGLGKFKTLKYSCILTTSSGESFEDGTELFLWISDDENRIPLYVETPIVVGSVIGRLRSYENLKYPLTSKIK